MVKSISTHINKTYSKEINRIKSKKVIKKRVLNY